MLYYVYKTHEIQFTQNVLEGDFRTAHARLRANAESIAFFGTLDSEVKLIKATFDGVVDNMVRRALLDWVKELFTRFFAVIQDINQTFIGNIINCVLYVCFLKLIILIMFSKVEL